MATVDPCDHPFIPVRGLTGCQQCGYARGHHPKRKPIATPPARKPDYRSLWETRKAVWVLATWQYLMRDMSHVPLYLYVQPTNGSSWGELITVREGDDPPAGTELVCPERIPNGTKQQIAVWLERFAGRLPVIPADL
jgi:hypothetical protein